MNGRGCATPLATPHFTDPVDMVHNMTDSTDEIVLTRLYPPHRYGWVKLVCRRSDTNEMGRCVHAQCVNNNLAGITRGKCVYRRLVIVSTAFLLLPGRGCHADSADSGDDCAARVEAAEEVLMDVLADAAKSVICEVMQSVLNESITMMTMKDVFVNNSADASNSNMFWVWDRAVEENTISIFTIRFNVESFDSLFSEPWWAEQIQDSLGVVLAQLDLENYVDFSTLDSVDTTTNSLPNTSELVLKKVNLSERKSCSTCVSHSDFDQEEAAPCGICWKPLSMSDSAKGQCRLMSDTIKEIRLVSSLSQANRIKLGGIWNIAQVTMFVTLANLSWAMFVPLVNLFWAMFMSMANLSWAMFVSLANLSWAMFGQTCPFQ